MRSPNAHIWDAHGLAPESHAAADEAMAVMLKLNPHVLEAVVREVRFQALELPARSTEFQKRYRWKPGTGEGGD